MISAWPQATSAPTWPTFSCSISSVPSSTPTWHLSRRHFAAALALPPRHAAAALAMAVFVTLRYLPALVASLTGGPLPAEVSGDITMYWLIVVSDLGIFIPIVSITAVGVWRGATWARPAMVATVGWFSIVSVAVAIMSLTMVVNDDRYASRAQLVLFSITTAVVGAYAIRLHRALGALPTGGAGQPWRTTT